MLHVINHLKFFLKISILLKIKFPLTYDCIDLEQLSLGKKQELTDFFEIMIKNNMSKLYAKTKLNNILMPNSQKIKGYFY